jgi:hypothetical protein
MNNNSKTISAEEFERIFDEGREDITPYLDMSSMRRINKETAKRVNVDFPVWMVEKLDVEASRLGVTRQSLIKFVINEHLGRART